MSLNNANVINHLPMKSRVAISNVTVIVGKRMAGKKNKRHRPGEIVSCITLHPVNVPKWGKKFLLNELKIQHGFIFSLSGNMLVAKNPTRKLPRQKF